MLVLTRKTQEQIHIGESVVITIVRIQGNTVRVGIEAPTDVRVVRGEVAARDLLAMADASAVAAGGMPQAPAAERKPPQTVGPQRTRRKPRLALAVVPAVAAHAV
jgi:carbon storage regulator CsrA